MHAKFVIAVVFQLSVIAVHAQHFWGNVGSTPGAIFSIDMNCPCPDCIEYEYIGQPPDYMQWGFSVSPDGSLYGLTQFNDIYAIDQTTGMGTLVLDLPYDPDHFRLQGLAFSTNNICYSIDGSDLVDTLFEINIVTGTATPLGSLIRNIFVADLTFFNGDLYYSSHETPTDFDLGLSRIILSNPLVSELVMDLPEYGFRPMTAYTQCHTLLSQNAGSDQFVLINLLDGDLTYVSNTPQYFFGITSTLEFETPGCDVSLDLDCDDSSGADGADFNSPDFICLTTNGVPICDEDILFFYDTLIDFIQIELNGFVPDGVNEYLELEQSYPGLTITGSGTQTILIQNDGTAPSTYFKLAMRAIRYHNDTFIATLGTRTVRANGATFYGTVMNEGVAYIDVAEWQAYDLDLGPDVELCDGEEIVISTNLQGVDHQWSTNGSGPSITITQSGQYSVTVSGDEFCPNSDTVVVTFFPNVTVILGNNQVSCEGDEVIVSIETESIYPLTIEIIAFPGDTITLTNVTGDIEIPLFLEESTLFIINNVITSQDICLEIEDADQEFEILPTYLDTISAGICEGDSFLIAPDEYVYLPGSYTVYENTQFGCDSIVTYHLQLSNSITIQREENTCMATDTGVFFLMIDNPDGCDTLLETHVVLGVLDTTFLSGVTCITGEEGLFAETLTSVDGCDSVVMRTIMLLPPLDTSWSYHTSCDPLLQGIFHSIYPNQAGCDSLVILTVTNGTPDTTAVFNTSCDPAELGVFETFLQNQNLCDSLVITTVTLGLSDTTYLLRTSCDSAFLGIHETLFINSEGCDSLVIETITYADKDSTHLSNTTCDPGDAGVFVSTFTNQFGCDSIVIQNVTLNISHEQIFQTNSCFVADTGIFIQYLNNQFGCDSVVTTIVDLLPSHSFLFESESCQLVDTGTFVQNFQNQFGCDSVVTHHIRLSQMDTTFVSSTTCVTAEAGLFEEWLTSQNGCDSLIITAITYEPTSVSIEIISDYNGYPISCFGSADGAIGVSASGSTPFTFQWSTNSTDTLISDLQVGDYTVTVTDGNGCSSIASVQLQEPPLIELGFIVSPPGCFENQSGYITSLPIGGVPPYQYSLDGISFQASPTFEQLPQGTYQVMVSDANQCITSTIVWINQLLPVEVELGDDIELLIGDSVTIQAIVNIPIDSLNEITWHGIDTTNCATCLTQIIAPLMTTGYTIEVVTHEGCVDRDSMTVTVLAGSDFYIPNIFSPNDDGANDRFTFYAGNQIDRISMFAIYDRWGGMMFLMEDRMPDDPQLFWDGRSNGMPCTPGVYVYRIAGVLTSRESIIKTGAVTLIR